MNPSEEKEIEALKKALAALEADIDAWVEAHLDKCSICGKKIRNPIGGPYCLLCDMKLEDARDIQQTQKEELNREADQQEKEKALEEIPDEEV